MNTQIIGLIERLKQLVALESSIIPWGSPIPSFGNIDTSKIATLGLNPSNREFFDGAGNELDGISRRFPTLKSLGISNWGEINEEHINLISSFCKDYFQRNPYDWFKRLDYIISGTSLSYYFPSGKACHLDLIPYATSCKWANLTGKEKNSLLEKTGDTLGLLLRNSSIMLLVLNGQTVVDSLEKIAGINIPKIAMPNWTLPRRGGNGIPGYSYYGKVTSLGGVELGRSITVLGYNHNIQSSFGVTTIVQTEIRNWITKMTKGGF